MSALEQIVRPFARPNTLARRRIIASSNKIDVPDAIISWGVAGTLPGAQEIEQIDEAGTSFEVLTCDDNYSEISRETVDKRIENPTDSNQYVIVQRPTSISFSKQKDKRKTYNVTRSVDTGGDTYAVLLDRNRKCQSKFTLENV